VPLLGKERKKFFSNDATMKSRKSYIKVKGNLQVYLTPDYETPNRSYPYCICYMVPDVMINGLGIQLWGGIMSRITDMHKTEKLYIDDHCNARCQYGHQGLF